VVTTAKHTMGETAQRTMEGAQQSFNTAAEYTSRVGEINMEIARRMTELWLEGFRKQSELSHRTALQFFEKVEEPEHVTKGSSGRSFPFVWAPYAFDPFAFWREWAGKAQEITRDPRETARIAEVSAPGNNVTFPISGYDEKNVSEVSRRLDTLTGEQLRRVKDYERRNKNRETLVQEIDRKIAAAS
jgi:hypothetical protein